MNESFNYSAEAPDGREDSELFETLLRLKEKNRRITAELYATRVERDKLRTELANFFDMQRERELLEDRVKAYQTTHKAWEDKIAKINRMMQSLEDKNSLLKEENQALQASLDKFRSIDVDFKEAQTLKEENQCLREELKEFGAYLKEKEAETESANHIKETRLGHLESELEELTSQVEHCFQTIEEKDRIIYRLKEENIELIKIKASCSKLIGKIHFE